MPDEIEEGDEVFDFEITEDDLDRDISVVDEDRSCLNCNKRNTCVVFQKFGSMLHPQQWEGPDEPPIKMDELAHICRDYSALEEEGDD